MPLPGPLRFAAGAAREVAAAALGIGAGSAALTAGLVAGSARAGYRTARSTAGGAAEFAAGSARLAGTIGVEGARITGLVLTGADPFAPGRGPARVAAAARELFEPADGRRTRRVWVDGEHAHVELAAPPAARVGEVRSALHRHLERLEGVDWVAVNEVVGRVLVAFDQRRISVDEVVGVITAVEQARGGREVFPRRPEHPADVEPLVAAAASLLLNGGASGIAAVGKVLPVPALSRHLTALLALVDAHPRVRGALVDRIGPVGTDLAFTAASAVLHTLTQSPTVPALHAASAAQRVVEVLARRAVWRAREPELCRPVPEDSPAEDAPPPGRRPVPLPPGPIETYRRRLAPVTLGGAVGLLALTRRPSRSADLLKGLSPRTATLGREAFAAVLDLTMCRRGVLPMDGSAYRRLDRVDAVVLDGDALCTGPPVVLEATATAAGWDDARVWTAAARLLGDGDAHGDGAAAGARTRAPHAALGAGRGARVADGDPHGDADGGPLRLGPPQGHPDGGRRHLLLDGDAAVGAVVVADELDPLAEALVESVVTAGHRLVLTGHAGVRELAGRVDEVADPAEPLVRIVRRLQAQGHGVLAVSVRDGPGLLAADVGIAPTRPDVPPAWGADLLTRPGLADAWRLVVATDRARRLSEWAVNSAITGNVLGGLAAAVGRPRSGQRRASAPGKTATAATMVLGSWTALRLDAVAPPAPTVHTPWHALEAEQVLRRLTRDRARSPDGAARPSRAVPPVLRLPLRFARTVTAELADPLTPVLGTGAAATALLGEATDAILVGGVMIGNALLSGLQRMRAESALESLLLEQEVVAHRESEGGTADVPAGELRVGDVLRLGPADVVPADARLVEAWELEVDESNLTGESISVAKSTAATPGADLAERGCMVFDGTTVVSGTGRAVVVAVGGATQAGRAATAAAGAAPPAGVQARLAELTRTVLPLTIAGGAAVAALGVLWRRPLREAVSSGVAVAVAAVPEGLPLVATVAQQAAARRLSGRGAVVRSARVLEALGRVDTVCFDKTGTLTENRLRVERVVPLSALDEDELIGMAARSTANGQDRAHETDRAVAEAAAERGVAAEGEPEGALAFTAARGFSVALRGGRLLVKGAPEVVLTRCDGGAAARDAVAELADAGLRVLAVADRAAGGAGDDLDEAARGLTLRGLVALADTVRPSAADAVAQLGAAGVRVLMLTGDHPRTAAAIAARAGVPDADRVVTGARFARASETERARLAREHAVFARLSPEQKVSVVAALRRAGGTVAVTGDGVNDAAAIRLADVGIGVAGAESPAARSAADLVLTDVDLTRLVDAVAEGRAMWSRVRDAVSVLVGGNAGEVAFTLLGTAFGGRAPLGTRQLLLVNLLTDMFPALAMAVAAPGRPAAGPTPGPLDGHPLAEVLVAGPYRGFTDSVRRMVLVRGAATAAGATGAWAIGRVTGRRRRASTMGLAALITTQLGQTAWAGRRSPLVLATTAASFGLLAGVVQTPGVSRFFGCTPLGPVAWTAVLGSAAAGTAGAELLPALLDDAAPPVTAGDRVPARR